MDHQAQNAHDDHQEEKGQINECGGQADQAHTGAAPADAADACYIFRGKYRLGKNALQQLFQLLLELVLVQPVQYFFLLLELTKMVREQHLFIL